MLQIIHDHSGIAKVKDIEKLLVEVRPSKSKWVNDERPGQDELYEHMELILKKLSNYSDHAYPFLKPVQKREAPNYYDIIKTPMDLGTVFFQSHRWLEN
jgi:transcriptional activator SPT7